MPGPGKVRQMLEMTPLKMPGRPALIWTPSQERRLVRLVVDADVPWKNIAAAMEEPGFAPKRSNCRKQWEKMTKINPSQLRLKDPVQKERRKQQSIQAFEAYQQRQSQNLDSTKHLPTTLDYVGHTETRGHSPCLAPPSTCGLNDDPRSKSSPNVLTLPPLSEAATPADSIAETQTPQYLSHSIAPPEIFRDLVDASKTPEQVQSPAQTFALDGEGKRFMPFDTDLVLLASPTSNPASHLNPSERSETLLAQTNEALTSHIMTTIAQESKIDGPRRVGSESVAKERSAALAKLEDDMSVPRGFIDFFKYQLSITRNSVASALSSSEFSRVPWRRKGPRQIQSSVAQPPEENVSEFVSYQPPSEVYAKDLWTHPGQPMETDGRAETSLTWELHLGGSTDEEIASRLEALINAGASPNTRNSDGETPLHVALKLGNLAACQVLLDSGADVHVKSLDGRNLSEYGKIVQNLAGDNIRLYLAIKTCRNAIKYYDPGQRAAAASRIARIKGTPVAGQKRAREQNEELKGGSRMKAPPKYTLENLKRHWPLPVQDPDISPFSELPPEVMPSDTPFLNMNSNRWSTNAQTMTAHNLEDHDPATSSFNLDLHSTCDIPAIPYLTQTPASLARSSPSVQKLVEQFGGRKTFKSPSVLPPMPGNSFDDWQNQEQLQAYPYSGLQNLHAPMSRFPDACPTELGSNCKHRYASLPPNGQPNMQVNPQQNLSSLRQSFRPPSKPDSVSAAMPPVPLSGYLTVLPTGQTALICPLPEGVFFQYAQQESNIDDCSLATVKIIPAPAVTVQHLQTAEAGAASTLVVSQGQIPQTTKMTTTPAWTGSMSELQPQSASLDSNFINDVRLQNASESNYIEGWDFSRPGFNR